MGDLISALDDTSFRTGADLFRALAKHVAELMGCRHGYVARIVPSDPSRARMLGWWNGAAFGPDVEYALAGTPCEHVIGRGVCIYPDRLQESFPENEGIRAMGLRSYAGVPMFAQDGARIGLVVAMDVKAFPSDFDAQPLRILSVRAATELARLDAERELRESRERLELALDATRDGLFDYDFETGDVDGNAQLWAMLGYERSELPTIAAWTQITHPDDVEPVRAALRAHAKQQTPLYSVEVRLRAKDGTWKWIFDRGRVVDRDPATGRARRMTGFHTDITARKQLEAQLSASGRLASIGTLAAGLAHEINTPLTYLSAGLENLSRQLPALLADAKALSAAPVLESLQIAREGAERVRQTVRDIKAFARPNDDERTAVDVGTIAAQAVRLARSELSQRARVVEAYGQVRAVEANASRLGQVFLNLLLNAAQAIEPGAPERNEVRITTYEDSAGRIVVEVRDTGRGIPAEVAPHVFDPFFTTKSGEGTGIGLWLCHRILEAIGGRISFDSEVGRGTCFRVSLPAASAKTQMPGAQPNTARARRRLLVIDDHANIGSSLRLFLEDEHEVRSATNASAALREIAADARFDLVLCDLRMPDATGMDVYRRVVEQAPELAPRVVFMTGGAYTDDAKQFLSSVPNLVLEKPFPPERVRELLEESTKRS